MNETENKQSNKPKLCKLSIASPLVAFVGFFVGAGLASGLKDYNIIEKIGLYTCMFSLLFGFLAGIIAYYKICRSKGLLTGKTYSISGTIASLILIVYILMPPPDRRYIAYRVRCNANLRSLGAAMYIYASDYQNQYPAADKWCDLLMQNTNLTEENFICREAFKNGDKGRCHYAMNPDCEPNSPSDMVLLFETKGGWNQYGGPELLTFENHIGKGCHILFNDSHVEFIRPDQLVQLNWNVEK